MPILVSRERRSSEVVITPAYHRPLSRRLDRCDRVIHNESGDPNGGNMFSFSGATCTSRVRHKTRDVHVAPENEHIIIAAVRVARLVVDDAIAAIQTSR